MESPYRGVAVRPLSCAERRTPTNENDTPLVIEPRQSPSASFLREFLSSNSRRILEDLEKHGALLLRGFDIGPPSDFEKHILSIRGMYGMRDILLSEPGRTTINGTSFVFHTNSLVKTGGTFLFGTFHTENYAIPDVPHYISFLCETPSKLGGETGLLNIAKVYSDVSDSVKSKLEEKSCLVSLYPVNQLVDRYDLSANTVKRFCERSGLSVISIKETEYVAIYKPSIVRHPISLEKALIVGFHHIPTLQESVQRAFSQDYLGNKWMLHRAIWKSTTVSNMLARMSNGRLAEQGSIFVTSARSPISGARTLAEIFSTDDIFKLARSMRNRYSSFIWKRGDILVVDNLKMAHCGMAGFGNRALKVMMCTPLPIPLSSTAPGTFNAPPSDHERATLGAQIVRLRDSSSSA